MPYSQQPAEAFWKPCRDSQDFRIGALYQPKFQLTPGTRIATAGSCFAQNIGRYITRSSLELVDVEPGPNGMPKAAAEKFGYGLFSARYGNIYTTRQLRQLLDDAFSETLHDCAFWERDGRHFDGLRPGVEPNGLATPEEVMVHRLDHLRRVREIFDVADVFIFTLGLTECWQDRDSGVIFPVAPGLIAGQYDDTAHGFLNFRVAEVIEDMHKAIEIMHTHRPDLKVLLTVSPVPLTATRTNHHVLRATTYSKSALRAAADELAAADARIDYFPSYEIITSPVFGGRYYKDNLRNVTDEGIHIVMSTFFGAYGLADDLSTSTPRVDAPAEMRDADQDEICEEAMLEAFAPK